MNADQKIRDASVMERAEHYGAELDRRDRPAKLSVLAAVLACLAFIAVIVYFAADAVGAGLHWWNSPFVSAPDSRPAYSNGPQPPVSPAPDPGRPIPASSLMQRAHSAQVAS